MNMGGGGADKRRNSKPTSPKCSGGSSKKKGGNDVPSGKTKSDMRKVVQAVTQIPERKLMDLCNNVFGETEIVDSYEDFILNHTRILAKAQKFGFLYINVPSELEDFVCKLGCSRLPKMSQLYDRMHNYSGRPKHLCRFKLENDPSTKKSFFRRQMLECYLFAVVSFQSVHLNIIFTSFFLQFSEFRADANCERFWMQRWIDQDNDTLPSSSPFDGDRPASMKTLLAGYHTKYTLQSIFKVMLSVLEYLSKATKTSQLNDYLLTYHKLGPRIWLDMQLEQQSGGNAADIYTNSPGIEYKGDAPYIVFKPLIVDRKCYYWSAIIHNF